MTGKMKLSAQKEWALEHYKGIENLFMPSFSPDFNTLDEEGIRHDVRNSIRHRFFSMLITPLGMRSDAENKQYVKIVCDEAGDKILKGIMVTQKDLAADLDIMAYAAEIGATHLFMSPAPSLRKAKTEEEVCQVYSDRIQATKLPIVLYGSFETLNKSIVPVRIFDRLANLPNVVAIKLTQPMNLAAAFHVCEKLSDRLLVGPVNLDFVPLLAKHYPVQWSGQWNVEAVQSPEKPYAHELLKALNEKRYDDAMDVYKAIEPALSAFFELQAPLIVKGGHPWSHMKYFQWCGGGNGGLLRETHAPVDQVPVLDEAARNLIKETYRKVGITPVDAPDEEFLVGKAAYSRGVRAKDMTETPAYS
ncbi:MAG: dihydrodipicolinate synthase family protein [Proteobacteria bacterium]|nr:dihydrodipicolinate synthase family protein [Pseudomonadota bacterium]MBU4471270.1 dihydrodipicolinate synthase family protein [Pseudomonadota bacterium]MCG2753890.1 dihydrodipicolinate synthase family protein [Desulfobacteraceae bacterium]